NNFMNLPKIITILGPTASGKTSLGVALAKRFNSEVVSADSRTVYKGMNIGTAKPSLGEMQGITHHLIDVVEPDEEFTLSDFKKMAQDKINDILKRGKLPIIVGGTGLYFWAIVDNLDMPAVAPDYKLRAELEKKSLEELVADLEKIDPTTAAKIDLKNPRRVLRALEVCLGSGGSFFEQRRKAKPLYDVLQIGLKWPREELVERINRRVDKQIEDGLVEEVRGLAKKYSWSLSSMSGIGYKQIGYFLRGEMSLDEAIEEIKKDTRQYAKRQMTWFKRDGRIKWIEKSDYEKAEKILQDFVE
ncbi:tRNA (adenosine(37)-N6)-dimethylallyltransferase MiaA, partial [Patescibacteria group bacterium]|nr:tRNA (adenosine(37)-N6)-dimethylallyltransferase MiaA [Patescibacteria group bacterium]